MLELNAVQKRKYPDVKVGDYVKVYKKKVNWIKNAFRFGVSRSTRLKKLKKRRIKPFTI